MSKTSTLRLSGRHRVFLAAAVIGAAVLLIAGPALSPALAGQAQEKGQEEKKGQEEPEEQTEQTEEPRAFTNEDLRETSRSSSSGSEAPAGGEGTDPVPPPEGAGPEGDTAEEPAGEADPGASLGIVTDDQSRGEEFWRQAVADAKGAVAAAKAEKDQLQSEMNLRRTEFANMDDPAARAVVADRIDELFELLPEADKAIADAEQALVDLRADARRSGALPGWLR